MIPTSPKSGSLRTAKRLVVLLGLLGIGFASYALSGILGWWLFGTRRSRPGSELRMELEIELVEAARGATRSIDIDRHEFCGECDGSGSRKGTAPPRCNDCGGRGEIIKLRGFFPVTATCPTCAGEGRRITDPCSNCGGAGRVPHLVKLQIEVPRGVESGMRLMLRNQGELGDIGSPRGDLSIHVLVRKHPIFDRRHNDLYCQLAVTDAAMKDGGEVQVPTLDGTCPFRIPKGTSKGDLLRINGLGMPDISGHGRGDIFVKIVPETPGK